MTDASEWGKFFVNSVNIPVLRALRGSLQNVPSRALLPIPKRASYLLPFIEQHPKSSPVLSEPNSDAAAEVHCLTALGFSEGGLQILKLVAHSSWSSPSNGSVVTLCSQKIWEHLNDVEYRNFSSTRIWRYPKTRWVLDWPNSNVQVQMKHVRIGQSGITVRLTGEQIRVWTFGWGCLKCSTEAVQVQLRGGPLLKDQDSNIRVVDIISAPFQDRSNWISTACFHHWSNASQTGTRMFLTEPDAHRIPPGAKPKLISLPSEEMREASGVSGTCIPAECRLLPLHAAMSILRYRITFENDWLRAYPASGRYPISTAASPSHLSSLANSPLSLISSGLPEALSCPAPWSLTWVGLLMWQRSTPPFTFSSPPADLIWTWWTQDPSM